MCSRAELRTSWFSARDSLSLSALTVMNEAGSDVSTTSDPALNSPSAAQTITTPYAASTSAHST